MIQLILSKWINSPAILRRGLLIVFLLISSGTGVILLNQQFTQDSRSELTHVHSVSPTYISTPEALPVMERPLLYQLLDKSGASQIIQRGDKITIQLESDFFNWHGLLTQLSQTAFNTAEYKLQINADSIAGDVFLTPGHFFALAYTPWTQPSQSSRQEKTRPLKKPKDESLTDFCRSIPFPDVYLQALWPERESIFIKQNGKAYRMELGQLLDSGWKLNRLEATSVTFSREIGDHNCNYRIPLAVAI